MSSSEHAARDEQCEECGTRLYRAGDRVPAGTYVRVDDWSFHPVSLSAAGPLPPSFDGHIAFYRVAGASCACERNLMSVGTSDHQDTAGA